MDTNTQKKNTCADRVEKEFRGKMEDIEKLWTLEQEGNEDGDPDLGTFNEYGLGFDYVPGEVYKNHDDEDEREPGFFRYQLSTGGPGDEFRFFTDAEFKVYKVEYWFLDWFDGAHKLLTGKDRSLMLEIFEYFKECGTVEHVFKESTNE